MIDSIGHLINKSGIPDKCPGCGISPVPVKVMNYDFMWQDGDVVCANCEHYIRMYDVG